MNDIENGMIIDELWEDRHTMSDKEYEEYLEYLDI